MPAENKPSNADRKAQATALLKTILINPWAITPQHFDSLQTIIGGVDPAAFIDFEMEGPESHLSIDENGIATIQIHGVMGLRLGFFDRLFGGISTEDISSDFTQAVESPDVKGIILHFDSPGGMVDGTKDLADLISSARGKKPIVAFTDSMMASAAYWVGSAADEIYATPTAQVGSIGVVAQHIDRSKAYEKMGAKKTYITSGKYKRMGNDTEPLSEEGREYLQGMVDHIYGIFAADVASNRPSLGMEGVNKTEARIYPAGMAMEAGLVDCIGSFQSCYQNLKRRAGVMTKAEFMAKFADLYKECKEDGAKEYKAGLKTAEQMSAEFPEASQAITAGAEVKGKENERKRITEIREAAFPGQDALVDELIKSSVESGEAIKKLMADEKAKRVDALNKMAASDTGTLGKNVKGDDTGKPPVTDPNAEMERLIKEKREKTPSLSYSQALNEVQQENPELAKVIAESLAAFRDKK